MCAPIDPSTRSRPHRFKAGLLLAILPVLLFSPRGLQAQEALSVEDPFTQTNGHPAERSPIGALGNGFNRDWGAHSNSPFCDFGTGTYGDYSAYCEHTNGNKAHLGSNFYGAYGEHSSGNRGYIGGETHAIQGLHDNGNTGLLGAGAVGVYGGYWSGGYGNYGELGTEFYGAYGEHSNGNRGYIGGETHAIRGLHDNGNTGILGGGAVGVYGGYWSGGYGNYGELGGSFYGARGWNANDNRGYLGHDSYGLWATGTPWAGYFDGDVHVTGTLTGGTAAFKVDHPLDPEGQYLTHSVVSGPDMKSVYDGTVTTDANGAAVVVLPDYFEALNRDFRYQLTVLGTFAQAVVAEKIRNNRFVIRTDQPGVEVSWQVTGIRQDAWAEAHRLVVEQAKPAEERGYYLHPGLYGQAAERSVAWARDPEGMRAVEEMPARLAARRRRLEAQRQRLDEERQRMLQQRARLRGARGHRDP